MKYFTLFFLNFVCFSSTISQIWTPVSPYPSGFAYYDIHMDASGDGIAVGDKGIISRTGDFGETFTNIYTGTTSQFNSIHKSQSGTYIIVGNEGTILRSVNDGLDWDEITFAETPNLNAVYFLSDDIGIILGENGTLLRTADDGKTWQRINLDNQGNLNKLTFINSTTGFIWSDVESRIYKTTDAGLNWIELYVGMTVNDAHFISENTGTVYGSTSSILKGKSLITNDGGITWQDSGQDISSFEEVKFVDNQTGFARNRLGRIYLTSDGGVTWEKKEGMYGPYSKIKAINSNLVYIVGFYIHRSYDLGETFENLCRSNVGSSIEEIAFGPNNDVYAVGTWGIYKSENNGLNFKNIQIDSLQYMEYRNDMQDVICYEPNNVMAIGSNSTFIQSSDGGETWEKKILPEIGYYVSMSKIDNTIWVVSDKGALMRSTDLGETWDIIHTFETDFYTFPQHIIFITSTVGFIGMRDGKVMRTENGGVDWEMIEIEGLIVSKCISFIDEKVGYMSGYGLYKTVDGGVNWELINTDLHYGYSLFFRNENIGYYAGEDGGIFKTEDGGISWTQEISFTNQYLFTIKFNTSGIGLSAGVQGTMVRIEEEPLSANVFNHYVPTTEMIVFPNPTTQEINLISENINDKSILHLYNINGHLITVKRGNQSDSPIDVRSLPVGTYYLLHTNGEVREKGVFVKQ